MAAITALPLARATTALGLLLFGILPFAGCDRPEPRPDVVLITIDTLRADHLGAYDRSITNTPRLDVLAHDSTVFEHAAAPMPLTRPSHFSLLTSLYPREHGAMNNAMSLPANAPSVVELFSREGYATGGFVGVRLLGPDSGSDRGFDFYEYPTAGQQRTAEQVIEGALRWLDQLGDDRSFFLWLHLFDPHAPYAPPPEFRGPLSADDPGLGWPELAEIAERNDGDVPVEELVRALTLYSGEISYVDHWIGKLLDALAQRRDPDRTVVAFTADHGECFENGIFFEHADCMYQPAIHIPLFVRYPSMFAPGDRVATQASIVDVAPTLLTAAGIPVPEGFSGRALQDATDFSDRHVLIQHPFFQEQAALRRPKLRATVRSVGGQPTERIVIDTEKVGIIGAEWKYLRAGDTEELYRIAPWPNELENLIESEPGIAAQMRERLARHLERHPLAIRDVGEINEQLLETLKALGYI